MGDNDLLSKVEAAAKSIADALDFSTDYTINTGLDDDEAELPIIVLAASNTGEEIPLGSGNYIVTLQVIIKTDPTDVSLANHRADTAILFDAFRQDNLHTTMSANAGLHVYPTRSARMTAEATKELLINTLELDFLACPSDL